MKEFDRLLVPLCSMLGLTAEEQKRLYERRKAAKLDPPHKKKPAGGFLGFFGAK